MRFYISDLDGLMDLVADGGLFVVPSAPVLVHLADDPAHRAALEHADVAVTDSGFMVLLWLARTGERLNRISGLRLLRGLLQTGAFRARGDTFWVMPSAAGAEANLAWLRRQGFPVTAADSHVAPPYARLGPLSDPALVALIESRRPRLVVVALSGGVQERLGWELRQRLGYRPTILCLGGAIAFLSGQQVPIPVWADRLALGWLFRFAAGPRPFAAKVREVWRLPGLIWRYRSASVAT